MKYKLIIMFLIFFMLLIIKNSYAAIKNGQQLLDNCREWIALMDKDHEEYDFAKAYACSSYIQGVVSMDVYTSIVLTNYVKMDWAYCPYANVSDGQIIRIVYKYLKNNPEKLHYDPVFNVINALKNAFPCKK